MAECGRERPPLVPVPPALAAPQVAAALDPGPNGHPEAHRGYVQAGSTAHAENKSLRSWVHHIPLWADRLEFPVAPIFQGFRSLSFTRLGELQSGPSCMA